MPTTVYETLEIKLSNGEVITVAPLKINRLKKFLAVVKPLQENQNVTEEQAMEMFVQAGMICMEQFAPDLAKDKEKFEDIIEVPTMMKILEVAGGLKLNDPNLLGASLVGTN